MQSDAVIVATGHKREDQFAHLTGKPGYINRPFDLTAYDALRLDSVRTAVLIGGGPTSLDAIRALEHRGYRGRYVLVSSALGNPWPYDPELYRPESFVYKPKFLRPEATEGISTYRDLTRLLRREVKLAKDLGFGPGHVYYALDLKGLEQSLDARGASGAAGEFIRLVAYLRSAIAVPENAEMLEALRSAGRLRYLKGRAESAHISPSENDNATSGGVQFEVAVRHRSGKTPVARGELLINCAIFPRGKDGDTSLAPGSNEKIYPVGPARRVDETVPRTWGVESFRSEICDAARKALRAVLNNH